MWLGRAAVSRLRSPRNLAVPNATPDVRLPGRPSSH
jgi:hypothetical protein